MAAHQLRTPADTLPVVTRAALALTLMVGCGGPPPAKVMQSASRPEPLLLANVRSEREAEVLALIADGRWVDPFTSGEERVRSLIKAGTPYTLLPSILQGTTAATGGTLSGTLRNDCGWLYLGFATPAPASGYAVIGSATVRSTTPAPHALEPAQSAAVLAIVEKATGKSGIPSEQLAYGLDLNENGKPEVVVVATHPELATDFADYKPEYHSLLVVFPDDGALTPKYAGYLQAAQGVGSFRVLQLDSVADVDLDGRLELLVTTRHAEGFQLLVFRYDGDLKEIYHSLGGEYACGNQGE